MVFLVPLMVYLANGRPHPEVDCVAAPYTAWSLVRHGSLSLCRYPELHRYAPAVLVWLPSGVLVSERPPGSALAALPFVAPLALLREEPLPPAAMLQLGKLVAANITPFSGSAAEFARQVRREAGR